MSADQGRKKSRKHVRGMINSIKREASTIKKIKGIIRHTSMFLLFKRHKCQILTKLDRIKASGTKKSRIIHFLILKLRLKNATQFIEPFLFIKIKLKKYYMIRNGCKGLNTDFTVLTLTLIPANDNR